MSIRRILTMALFMLAGFFGLKALAAPDWAAVLVSIALGEFLWSKERRRAAREIHTASLRQMMISQRLMLEMKFNDAIARLGRSGAELSDAGAERETEPKTQLI